MQEKCNKSTEQLLETLHKNLTAAKQSLLDVMPKVESVELKNQLTEQLDTYEKYCNLLKEQMNDSGDGKKLKNLMVKVSARLDVEMNTLTDDSDEHIAQILIEDTTQSITDIIRTIREQENACCSEKALALAKDTVKFQEKCVEKIKKHL